jgi:hypothetical protein
VGTARAQGLIDAFEAWKARRAKLEQNSKSARADQPWAEVSHFLARQLSVSLPFARSVAAMDLNAAGSPWIPAA